ncbi:hypothetical protein HRG84_19990 [Flavisolibacter sp. BT320]|nr:hypothetical protein [Flavisolibacter longurius]
MADNFFLVLAAILLLPVIPAYIIYKFLPPSDTDVRGPYKGLSLKLKGAFAGYFLLVIVGLALQYTVMNNKQQKQIEALQRDVQHKDTAIAQLQAQIAASANPVIDWHIKGAVTPVREGTRFFYDDGTTRNDPDGSFDLIKRAIAKEGKASPPTWVCIYNNNTGSRVISLNRERGHPDLAAFNVEFDDQKHEIHIKRPIDINSIEKDSIVAVANFIEKNAALKTEVQRIDPSFLGKADKIREEKMVTKAALQQFNNAQQKRTQ